MIKTAIVVCPGAETPEAGLLGVRVAGLPLVTRVLLTAQQAGVGRFVVVASGPQQGVLRPQIEEDHRLQGRVRWIDACEPPPTSADSLLLLPSVVLEAGALRRWLERDAGGGWLVATEGATGPLIVPAPHLPACIKAAQEGLSGLAGLLAKLGGRGEVIHIPWDGAPQRPIRSAGDVPGVEGAMLEALGSPDDGPILDRFVNRRLSGWLTRRLVRCRVSPNQITAASLFTGLLGAWLLGREGALASLAGLLLFQLSVVLDHSDGELARLTFRFSRLGKWLDNFSDHAVGLAVIACVAWRVAAEGGAGRVALLGILAAVGVTGSFLVVFWWTVAREGRTAPAGVGGRRGLASMANRDGFCLAL
ncbi:MAG TPA: CDP-alcohol phosphatidyltransferase family protein, partial [Candidatus Methylomirabilis sp.]|nr:CDP-alcohol phosphatidyltransferase family protein [Candidatus Methylomirabilis sp.]